MAENDLQKGKWAEKGKFVDTIDDWAKHVLDVSPKVEKEVKDKLFSGKSLDTIDLLTGYYKDCNDKKKS